MSIKTYITDITTGLKAKVVDGEEENALVVATRPLKTFTNKILFFSNPTYGIDMNQSLSPSGTFINIHNGIDNAYWTASGIVGVTRWDFNSSTQSHTGSYSINGTSTLNGDESQYAKGSNQNLTGHTSLTGWIYITGWATVGTLEVQIYGWDVGVGIVGNTINIGDYINTDIFNTWHKFIIPLADLDLLGKTIDAIRIKTVAIGGVAPNYYIDDIQVQENELPIEFTIEPDKGTWLHVDQINTVMADALNTVLADASMYNLSYDKFLGLAELPIGLLHQEYHDNKITLTSEFKHLLDFLQLPNTNILNVGCDGTNTWFNLSQQFGSSILLKSENEDKMVISVRDDMSDLLKFRMAVSCREENRCCI